MLLFVLFLATTSQADDRPNIIVFYTDDHGHADLSCQGVVDDIRTPHVDALAAGLEFCCKAWLQDNHITPTAPQCVPSRAGLLVGKFQSRFGDGEPLLGLEFWQGAARLRNVFLQRIGKFQSRFGWTIAERNACACRKLAI